MLDMHAACHLQGKVPQFHQLWKSPPVPVHILTALPIAHYIQSLIKTHPQIDMLKDVTP